MSYISDISHKYVSEMYGHFFMADYIDFYISYMIYSTWQHQFA